MIYSITTYKQTYLLLHLRKLTNSIDNIFYTSYIYQNALINYIF
jgi:hypothetical protein